MSSEEKRAWVLGPVSVATYAGFVLSAVLGSVARICAYRYGLPGRHAW
jgi:hypothetical protein